MFNQTGNYRVGQVFSYPHDNPTRGTNTIRVTVTDKFYRGGQPHYTVVVEDNGLRVDTSRTKNIIERRSPPHTDTSLAELLDSCKVRAETRNAEVAAMREVLAQEKEKEKQTLALYRGFLKGKNDIERARIRYALEEIPITTPEDDEGSRLDIVTRWVASGAFIVLLEEHNGRPIKGEKRRLHLPTRKGTCLMPERGARKLGLDLAEHLIRLREQDEQAKLLESAESAN